MKNKFFSFVSRLFNGQSAGPTKSLMTGAIGGATSIDDGAAYAGVQTVLYADHKQRYVREGFASNDIIYAIINTILKKIKVSQWGWYTVEDEKAYTEYCNFVKVMSSRNYETVKEGAATQIHKDFKTLIALHHKAIKPFKPGASMRDGKLTELIKYPNSEQTWNDLLEEGCGFKLITGDKFRVADISQGPLTRGLPDEINNLASQHMIIIREADRFPYRAGAYRYQCGIQKEYTRDEILHEKYFNPMWDAAGTHLYGFSPVQAAWLRMNRTKKGQLATSRSYDNGGSSGAMWPKTAEFAEFLATMNVDVLDETKARVKNAIGGGINKSGDIAVLGSGPWEHKQFNMSVVDLAIIEAEKWDMPMLCNVWNMPSQIMNDPNNKTFNNSVSGEKALTLRCAWPLLVDERDNMNRKFRSSWGLKGSRIVLDFDPTVFTELEEDKASQTKWLLDAYWYTPNQRLQMQGEPVSPDKNMDRYWIPSNLIPMDDASTQEIDPKTFLNE